MALDDIILRSETHSPLTTKGSVLTWTELDENFINIYEDSKDLRSLINNGGDYIYFHFENSIPQYVGGITQYGAIKLPPPQMGSTYAFHSTYRPLEFIAPIGSLLLDTSGFIPEPVFFINSSTHVVDLKIIPGMPAQFSTYTTHLNGSHASQPGYYRGEFTITMVEDDIVVFHREYVYIMQLDPIL